MNKTHRIVWSEARQTYVVAHENAAACGKSSSTRKGVVQAVAVALLALGAGAAVADSCGLGANVLLVNTTDPCLLTTGESLTINSGVSLEVSVSVSVSGASSVTAVSVSGSPLASDMANSGTIKGMAAGSTSMMVYGIKLAAGSEVTGTITNSGLISAEATISGGSSRSGTAIALGLSSARLTGSIINSGSILSSTVDNGSSNNRYGYGIGLDNSSLTGSIVNTGTIDGQETGINVRTSSTIDEDIFNSVGGTISGGSNGIAVNGSTITGAITNAGLITAMIEIGDSGIGALNNTGTLAGWDGIRIYRSTIGTFDNSQLIDANQYGVYIHATSVTSFFNNSGTIKAPVANGVGLSFDNLSDAQSGVTNSGTISGGSYGVRLLSTSLIAGGLTNSGTISGGMYAIYSEALVTLPAIQNLSGGLIDGAVQILRTTDFSNSGILAMPAASSSTVTGTYTQNATGTLRTRVADSTTYGKLTVSGTATMDPATHFDVVFADTTSCAGLTVAGTLAGMMTSTGSLSLSSGTSFTGTVTHNCLTPITVTAVKNGSAVDLVAASAGPTTWPVTGATNNAGFGTVSCDSTVANNGTATCTGTASGGYALVSAAGSSSVCGTVSVSGNTITAGPVTAACTVTGTFAASNTYAVTASANPLAGGSVTCTPASGIASGGSSTCSGTANPGYTFTNWGGDCSSAGSNASCTLSNITAAKSVTANFTTANTAPAFVGATTTLTVAQGASATDVKSLLHASDSDASQTLTWTQSSAPTHGTLSITSATAASGSADVTPGGTITYAPTAGYVGSDNFTVQVSDGTATATRSITVTVSAPTVTVGALTLNSMTVGTAYTSQSFVATGGYGAYTYSVSAGTLPAGLSLNASTGALTGTPTTAGAYSFTIQAVDSSTGTGAPFAGTQAFSGTVAAAVVGNVCDPTQYPITNATKTGTGPYTFAISGAINAGLSCNFTGNGDALTVAGSGSISTTGATNAVNAASTSVDSIQNSGLISSVTDTLRLDHSTVAQGISNSGTIENLGTRDAIFMASSTVNGGLTNGGTISGATNAITSDASTTLAEVLNQAGGLIDGRVSILSTTNVTNAGTIALPASTTSTIGGTYTQDGTGTLRTKAISSSAFGKLTVNGTATLPAAAKFDVATGNAATCGGITVGTTLAGVISAASLSSSTFAVTDDCTNIDFTAVQSGNAINLVAVAPAPTTWVVTGASNNNSYGTVSCATPVANNGTATCTGTASGGYALVSAAGSSVCGTVSVSGSTITAGPVTAACTVTGTFAASNTYAVTASANPLAGGSVSCTPASGIASGGSSTCSGTANPGYTFTNWGGDCASAGSNATCTLSNITTAKSVTANFTAANTNQASIPTTANGVSASMSVSGCTSISTAAFAAPTTGAPSNTSFPFGMLGFTLNGCISGPVTVTVTYAQPLPSGATFYKNINGTYSAYPATLGANTVTFSLTDGGSGDADGLVNGSIRDPGGIGVPATTTLVEPLAPEVPVVPLIPPLASLPALPGVGNSGRTFLNLAEGAGPSMTGCLRTTLNDLLGPDWQYQGQSADGGGRLKRATDIISFYPIEASSNTTYGLGQGAGIYLRGGNPMSVVTNCGTFVTAPALYNLGEFGALLNAAGLTAQINAQGVITYPTGSLTYAVRPDYRVTQGNPAAPALTTGTDGQLRFTDSAGHSQILYPAFLDPELLGSQVSQAVGGWTVVQTDGTALLTLLNGQKFVLTPDLALGTVPAGTMTAWWQDGPNHYSFRNSGFSNTSQGFSVTPR